MAGVAAQQLLEPLQREAACPVCFDTLAAPVAYLPCLHYFCKECIGEAMRHSKQCPICKLQIRTARREVKESGEMSAIAATIADIQQLVEAAGGQ